MAAYFHGSSEIQADSLQTLYLMNPNYVGYSDTQQQQQPTNMFLLNPSSVSHAPPANTNTQHFVGIPLTGAGTIARSSDSDDPSRQMGRHDENPDPNPSFHYNLWGALDQTVGKNSLIHIAPHSANALEGNNSVVSGFRSPAKQALSLSLSSQQVYKSVPVSHDLLAGVIFPRTGEVGASSSSVSAISNGIYGMQSVGLGNKYLQAAQQLLDEVVDVGKATKDNSKEGPNEKSKDKESIVDVPHGDKSITKGGAELTTSERQEFQMKKAKLVSMLDEVEQRYRQYHHQMQIVVNSFEQAAGLGSAKSYTSLALQTISKQFRCLKDAISAQIKAISNSLGEAESVSGKLEGSRLKFVDHHLRQQRALQQMGIMQHNAWRPQRGLPERAVSVLRAWLFEHFLHPYPKDSDKHTLAKQTGLTRSQVSNWFINARVRLWKPMVEEMYTEELKEQQQNGGTGCSENTSKGISKNESGSKSAIPQEITTLQLDQPNTLKSHQQSPINHSFSPTEISTSNVADRSPKKPRSDTLNSPSSILDMKPGPRNKGIHESAFSEERINRDGYHLHNSEGTGFGSYPIGELGRFSPQEFSAGFHGNGVSLTLGLPHCDNLSISPTQQINLSNQNIPLGSLGAHYNEINLHNPQPNSHSNNGTYDDINLDHNRKRFATQLLHDFVA